VLGMMFGWKPDATSLFGSTIDSSTKAASFPWRAVSRSGPIVADEPAALKVWQPPQPADAKTSLPAAASPLLVFTVCVGSVGRAPSTVSAVGLTTVAEPQPATRMASPERIPVTATAQRIGREA
jgi:hypothetical protein